MTFLVRDLTTVSMITLLIPATALRLLPRKERGGSGAGPANLGLPYRSWELQTAPGGLVVYVDLLAPDVLLYHLGVLDHVLADSHLFLGHGALLHHDLFLSHGDAYLVLAYLGLGGCALREGYPLHGDLLVAGGHFDALAVCANALADFELAGLALTGTCSELFLGPLNPELVLVLEVAALALADPLVIRGVAAELAGLGVAHPHARANGTGGLFTLVGLVGAALLGGGGSLEAVVGVDLALELGGDLPVVVEGRAVLGRVLVGSHRKGPTLVVDGAYRVP